YGCSGNILIACMLLLFLQDEKIQLEKQKADLAVELTRANSASEQAEAAAQAAESSAEQRLQDLLHQLEETKFSSDAASTTSEFVRKVAVFSLYCNSAGTARIHVADWLMRRYCVTANNCSSNYCAVCKGTILTKQSLLLL